MTSVTVLFEGFSKQNGDFMTANCSCTLIKSKQCVIIVDTMTAWDGDKIKNALMKHNIMPDDVNYVVCSHSHADHIGNNNLFLKAEHIVGLSTNIGEIFVDKNIKNEPYILCDGVEVVATPGHTAEDVTVIVNVKENENEIQYAVVGDLFEKEEDITNPIIWKSLGTPELQKTQAKMRWHVLNNVNYIIPGHGPMFKVTNDMKKNMKDQLIKEGLLTDINDI